MSLTLQRFAASGELSYISKHNSNAEATELAVNGLETTVTAALGATVSVGASFAALFGPSLAVVGASSYKCTGAGSTLTVQPGFVWKPGVGLLQQLLASTPIAFAGLSADTYYIYADTTGTPQRTTDPTEAIYSVVWTGAAFGTITRIAAIVWASGEWLDAQASAALGASYDTLDLRLEAGETIAKANETAIATYGTGATLTLDTDVALAADSDANVATQKAVKAYVDGSVGGLTDAMVFKGVIDCSTNPNYPAANAGDVYKVSVAGKIGGASGPTVEVADSFYCITDGTAAGTHAAVGAQWAIFQANIDIDTDVTLAADSDAKVPSQKAVKAYVDASKTFDVYSYCPGAPDASALMLKLKAGRAATIPDDFAGSYADAEVAATASTDFDVKKNGASVGTINFAISATVGTFVTSGGTVALAAGDKLTVVAPVTPDASLADISFTIVAART